MERLSLDELLRHTFAGAVLLVTTILAYPGVTSLVPSGIDPTALVAVGAGAVLLLGSLIYVLHRALVYPIVYWLGVKLFWRRTPRSPMELDLERFARRNDEKSLQKHLGEWASQVHFLYCITWAAVLGLIAGLVLQQESRPSARQFLIGFALVTAVASLVHHARLLVYDREVARRESGATRPETEALPASAGCNREEPADL